MDFFQRKFAEHTVPELVRQVTLLNNRLENLNSQMYQMLKAHEELMSVLAPKIEAVGDINQRIQERMNQINSEPKENN